ncbi:hypothetical protein SNE40_009836 [Patella caerulea]|uniref:Uncharacterized protein n=1 Tax=Patella caerulea TaxID=87958 RepID=A0AAN8JPC7_PATCE
MLYEAFQECGLIDFESKWVGFMADGASVNMGKKHGLGELLKKEMDWLIVIHCLNHRLELAAKDTFSGCSEFGDMMAILNSLRSLYNHSPKRLRELRELAEIMEQTVSKPEKALGTRWLQHKRSACNSLIKSFPVIVTHLENIAEDPLAKKEDQSKMKGYLSKLKSFKFVVSYLLYFSEILEPLSKLSLLLQGSSIDLLFAMSCLDTFYTVLKDFSTINLMVI